MRHGTARAPGVGGYSRSGFKSAEGAVSAWTDQFRRRDRLHNLASLPPPAGCQDLLAAPSVS